MLDSVDLTTGSGASSATVTGWTYDYDVPTTAIKAVLYLNGQLAAYGPTSEPRSDVDAVFGITGTHGYSFSIALPRGQDRLCMYGINAGTGSNTAIGCRTVTG